MRISDWSSDVCSSDLNDVRQRAGLEPKTGADVPNQETFRRWVAQERRVEFAFENLRWFDLVRTDRALDVMGDFLSEYGLGANVKDRKSVVSGKGVSVRVDLGGARIIKNKKKNN